MFKNVSLRKNLINLVKEIGLNKVSKETRRKLIDKMTALIQKRVVLKLYDKLPSDDQEAFDKLLDNGAGEEVEQFLMAKIPQAEEVMQKELSKIKREIRKHIKDLILALGAPFQNDVLPFKKKGKKIKNQPLKKIYVRHLS